MKILILGNSGSGKSTMAARLSSAFGHKIAVLSLDEIAWEQGVVRRSPEASRDLLLEFIRSNGHWIIEGCYAELMSHALPFCDELRFLNPGIDACVEQARKRDWEPEKFADAEAQNAMLPFLLQWIAEYETRSDEFGLARHRALFDGFDGPKIEYTSVTDYALCPREGKCSESPGAGK